MGKGGGLTLDLDPAPDPYLGCTFKLILGSTLAPVPSMSHLSSSWWGGSTPDLDPAPDPYLGYTF